MRNIILGLVTSSLFACAACSVSTAPASSDQSSDQSAQKGPTKPFTVAYDNAPSSIYVARLTSAGSHSAVSSVEEGATGTVTLTRAFAPTDDLTTAEVLGSYDITFPEGEVTGTILSGACASDLNEVVPAAAP